MFMLSNILLWSELKYIMKELIFLFSKILTCKQRNCKNYPVNVQQYIAKGIKEPEDQPACV